MTEVAFHFNAPDKQGYACRLLRKAYLRGARLVVLVDEADRSALDSALWTVVVGEFLPHSNPADPPHVQARSPIHLTSELPAQTEATVLVNLRADMPDGYDRFARVIEVVTGDDTDRGFARERWKRYKAQGIEPQRHDLQLTSQD